MIDFDAPSSTRAIEALEDSDTRTHLLKFGIWLAHSEAAAKDLLADALLCVCDPQRGRPWDPARASFRTHMRMVMADLAKRERRSARARRERVGLPDLDYVPGESVRPDDALSDARMLTRLRRMGGRLRERLFSRTRALQTLDHRIAGVESAAKIARLLDCPVEEIYDANDQIAYHAAVVLAEERVADEVEMKERRDRFRKDKRP